MGQGITNGTVGHLRRLRVVVLATFQRNGVATLRAHVLGGAHAIQRVGAEQLCALVRLGARQALLHTHGKGGQPAFHDALGAQAAHQGFFFCGACEGFQRARIVLRPQHRKRLCRRLKRVQIKQDIVLRQHGAQLVGNAVFKILRGVGGAQIAVQVALAVALPLLVCQRVGHRYKGHRATHNLQRTGVQLAQYAFDATGAAKLGAVHRTQNNQFRAGL